MKWMRVYITVEGPTEKEFADKLLKPHFEARSIQIIPKVVLTNRKLGSRGGIFNFSKIESDLRRQLKQDNHSESRFTTMIDLYALPNEFPGWAEAQKCKCAADKIAILEKRFSLAMRDNRFIPYIQLHEFEALLYCDLGSLQKRVMGSEEAIKKLTEEVAHLQPEDINDRPETAPSQRIINHLSIYKHNKVRVGAPAAAEIGLEKLRLKCPHFGSWISKLEALR